jgi:pyruvate/2-oxoglutarate dehydrogenase complex dihydrolipoamide dehydrogenase (E3) component
VDAVALVRAALVRDGVSLHEGATARSAARTPKGVSLSIEIEGGQSRTLEAGHLLVAAGRRPDFSDLDLEAGQIQTTRQGITVDAGLLTSNRRVFAVGDCTGHPAFTHVASYHAGIVIRRALFRLPAKVDYSSLPWVTFTDPELAQVGQIAAGASASHGDGVEIIRLGFEESDRARTERMTDGFIKIVAGRRGRILGVTIVGHGAGELLAPWCLAMSRGLKLSAMAGLTLPYPTMSELSAGRGAFYAPRFLAGTPPGRTCAGSVARYQEIAFEFPAARMADQGSCLVSDVVFPRACWLLPSVS